MQHAEHQRAEYKKQFSSRRRSQIVIAIAVVAMVALLAMSEQKEAVLGVPLALAGPVATGLILCALAFSLYNWRCPACNGYLGKAISPKFCAKCGVELS